MLEALSGPTTDPVAEAEDALSGGHTGPEDAQRVVIRMVRRPARQRCRLGRLEDDWTLPVDIAFGVGQPRMPIDEPWSVSRPRVRQERQDLPVPDWAPWG